jgi:hypothetical protein
MNRTAELLSVARIYGGYAVLVADDAILDDTDLLPGTIVAAFATREAAQRYVDWLVILRHAYHGAQAAYL